MAASQTYIQVRRSRKRVIELRVLAHLNTGLSGRYYIRKFHPVVHDPHGCLAGSTQTNTAGGRTRVCDHAMKIGNAIVYKKGPGVINDKVGKAHFEKRSRGGIDQYGRLCSRGPSIVEHQVAGDLKNAIVIDAG